MILDCFVIKRAREGGLNEKSFAVCSSAAGERLMSKLLLRKHDRREKNIYVFIYVYKHQVFLETFR